MARKKLKRFSVSLSPDDYEALRKLADEHRPSLTLQYVVEYAIRLLLDRVENPQLSLDFGDPFSKGAK
jgi:hypothetical protein